MGVGGDWYSWGSPPTGLSQSFCQTSPTPEYSGRPASQWGPGYSTEEDALARSRMQHSQEELRASGGVRGHHEVDLGGGGRVQEQEQEVGGGTARDLSQRAGVTSQSERLGINSNIYSLYQGQLAGQRQGQFSTDDLSGQHGRARQDGVQSMEGERVQQQMRESPRAMEPDSSTEDPPTSKKDTGGRSSEREGASVEEGKIEVYNKEDKTLPNFDKDEGVSSQGGRDGSAFNKEEEGTPERMSSFTFNKNEKILNFNKDAERSSGYSKDVEKMASEASSISNIVPPALKKKRFSNSLLEQFGDLVKSEHVGEFPLSVEINELDSSSESVSPPRAPPFPLNSPHSPLSPRKRGRKPKHYSEILFELGQRGISITKTRPGEPDPRISHKVSSLSYSLLFSSSAILSESDWTDDYMNLLNKISMIY